MARAASADRPLRRTRPSRQISGEAPTPSRGYDSARPPTTDWSRPLSQNKTTSRSPSQTRRDRRREERLARREVERRAAARPIWRSPTLLLTIGALAVGLVVVAAIVLTGRPGATAGPSASGGLAEPASVTPTDLASGNTLGSADAPVTLDVYEDFQCPICGQFATSELPRLVTDFVRPGTLRITTHDLEFLDRGTTESLDTASATYCAAQQDRYWPLHDWLYANQAGENLGGFAADRLRSIETAAGLDLTKLDSCLASGTAATSVRALTQQTLAAGINATPTLVLNGGQKFSGLPSYEQLATVIRSLAGAKASPSAGASGATPAASQ